MNQWQILIFITALWGHQKFVMAVKSWRKELDMWRWSHCGLLLSHWHKTLCWRINWYAAWPTWTIMRPWPETKPLPLRSSCIPCQIDYFYTGIASHLWEKAEVCSLKREARRFSGTLMCTIFRRAGQKVAKNTSALSLPESILDVGSLSPRGQEALDRLVVFCS